METSSDGKLMTWDEWQSKAIDDGWIAPHVPISALLVPPLGTDGEIERISLTPTMTGQEWYDKFATEWNRSVEGKYFNGDGFAKAAQDVAKKASGIK